MVNAGLELDASTARLQSALDTLAEHDRPFRRRGHEAEISDAHRAVESLADKIRSQAASVKTVASRIHDIDRRLHRAEALDKRRPTMETQLADLDDRLDQHQTAYGLETGLGPTRGPRLPIGFLHSRSLIQKLTNDLEQSITRQRHQEREVESPSLGIGR